MSVIDYKDKYMKYKKKYLDLKSNVKQVGGSLEPIFEIKCKIINPEKAEDLGVDVSRWDEEKEYTFIYAYATHSEIIKLYLKDKPNSALQIVDCGYNDPGKKDEDEVEIPKDFFYFELASQFTDRTSAEVYMDTDGMEMERLQPAYSGILKQLDDYFDDSFDEVPDAISYRKINDFFRTFSFDEDEDEDEDEEEGEGEE